MGVCIAPLPSPTLLIREGSHVAARTRPFPSGSANGPNDGLKVVLVKKEKGMGENPEEIHGWKQLIGRKSRL